MESFGLKFKELKELDGWLKLLALFRPKFYNKLTWWVVGGGLALLSTSLFELIISELFNKSFDLTLLDGNEGALGVLLIAVALLYNFGCKLIESKEAQNLKNTSEIKATKHDVEIFRKLDSILDEETLISSVEWVESQHFYTDYQWNTLDNFCTQFQKTSNNMLSEELNFLQKQLVEKVEEFQYFLACHFFSDNRRGAPDNSRRYMYPDLNPDRTLDIESKGTEIYNKRSEELTSLARQLIDSYMDYRKNVKMILHI